MKTLACTLIIAAGLIVSYILISEEREKISKMRSAVDFISYMKTQIANFRTPVGEIIDTYTRTADVKNADGLFCGGASCLAENLEEYIPDGGGTRRSVSEIMDSDFNDAARRCEILEKRVGEVLENEKNSFHEKKKTLIIIPTAACLLLVILIM